MSNTSIYKTAVTVGIRDTDFKGVMRLSSMLRHFQEAANNHVNTLGIGIADMEANNHIAWILARVRIAVTRYPKLNEELTIETWPQLPGAIEFQRDFIIKDASGNSIVEALSSWVIIDTKTKSIQRSTLVSLNHLKHPQRTASGQ